MNPLDAFTGVDTVLVIDWPSKEVPELLAIAGFRVVVRGGPGPQDYSIYQVVDGQVAGRIERKAPDRAELIYSFRPLSELPEIIATARRLHAKTIWTQSGLSAPGVKDRCGCWLPEEEERSARNLVETAGFSYLSEPYIGTIVRQFGR